VDVAAAAAGIVGAPFDRTLAAVDATAFDHHLAAGGPGVSVTLAPL
jgi:hypothetical protein